VSHTDCKGSPVHRPTASGRVLASLRLIVTKLGRGLIEASAYGPVGAWPGPRYQMPIFRLPERHAHPPSTTRAEGASPVASGAVAVRATAGECGGLDSDTVVGADNAAATAT
jgi:hypothetical protein